MITLLLVATICTTALAAPQLVSSSFVANSFASADGWQLFNGIQGFDTRGAKSIFGGHTYFGQNSRIIKFFTLPAHHTIQLKFILWAPSINTWENEVIKVHVDGFLMTEHLIHRGYISNFEQYYGFDIKYAHNAPTAFVMFSSSLDQSAADESWGLRDFWIYVYPCPVGCQLCTRTDTGPECTLWTKAVGFFSESQLSSINNEGWVSPKPMQFNSCGGITTFGFYKAEQVFSRSAYIEPHYRMRVKLLVFKVDDWLQKDVKLVVDGTTVYTYKFTTDFRFPSICNTDAADNTQNEALLRIDQELPHTNQLPLFEISTTLEAANVLGQLGIRDFEIYIAKCIAGCITCSGPTAGDCTMLASPPTYTALNSAFTANTFTSVDSWTVIQLITPPSGLSAYTCEGYSIFGGHDVLGKDGMAIKDYLFLPTHRRVKVVMDLYEVDHLLYRQRYNEVIDHTRSTLTIKIFSTIDEYQSFGFRNLKIYTGTCPGTCGACVETAGACQTTYSATAAYQEFTLTSFTLSYGWSLALMNPTPLYTTCAGKTIMGGVGSMKAGNYIYKVFDLPNHTSIRVQMLVYVIDKWINESVIVKVDNVVRYSQIMSHLNAKENLCGGVTLDQFLVVDMYVAHTTHNSVKIEITSDMDYSDSETWGFRDFQLSYLPP